MKPELLLALCLLATASALAQGKALFGNRISGVVDAKVYEYVTAYPFHYGGPYPGSPLDHRYAAEAWVGPPGGSLAPIPGSQIAFRSGAGAGYIPTITITVPFPQGTTVDAQMRVWKGAPSLGWAGAGWLRAESLTITTTLAVDPTPVRALLPGMRDFSIDVIIVFPEPSTLALAVPGAAVLLLRRRK